MRASLATLRTPLIRFLGKRSIPSVDHAPRPHPQGPNELPSSFAQYRQSSQTHGPLARNSATSSQGAGVFASVSELPLRFRYKVISELELENINTGGAAVVF